MNLVSAKSISPWWILLSCQEVQQKFWNISVENGWVFVFMYVVKVRINLFNFVQKIGQMVHKSVNDGLSEILKNEDLYDYKPILKNWEPLVYKGELFDSRPKWLDGSSQDIYSRRSLRLGKSTHNNDLVIHGDLLHGYMQQMMQQQWENFHNAVNAWWKCFDYLLPKCSFIYVTYHIYILQGLFTTKFYSVIWYWYFYWYTCT